MNMDQQPRPHPPKIANESFVFLDTRGKRWPRLKFFLFIVGGLLFLATILFVQTLVLPSQLALPPAVEQLKSRLKSQQNTNSRPHPLASKPLWLDFAKAHPGLNRPPSPAITSKTSAVPQPRQTASPQDDAIKEIRLGFYQSWDPGSLDALKARGAKLTHLSPDWLTISDGLGTLAITKEAKVVDLIGDHPQLVLLPLLSNLVGKDSWNPEAVEGIINGPSARQCIT